MLLPNDQMNLRVLVAALIESGRLKDAQTSAGSLVTASGIDLGWIARSPWPKSMLVRIEAALGRLASTLGD